MLSRQAEFGRHSENTREMGGLESVRILEFAK